MLQRDQAWRGLQTGGVWKRKADALYKQHQHIIFHNLLNEPRITCLSEKGFPIYGVPFLPSKRIWVLRVPCFNLCKMVPPHFSHIFVYGNNFEKLLQDFCPFCIFFICLHFLYQHTIWNFLIYHLGVRIPVPDKWVLLRSSETRFDKI